MMTGAEIRFVEIPKSEPGSIVAEQAATLILKGLGNHSDPNPNPTRQEILDVQSDLLGDHAFIVALNAEDTVVGTGGLRFFAEPLVAVIVNVVVAPEERRRGIATNIISILEAQASGIGAEAALVMSTRKAVGLYERLGYRETERPYPYTEGKIHAKSLS